MAAEQKTTVEQVAEDAPAQGGAGSDKGVSVAAAAAAAQGISPSVFQKQQSAAEKKARKAMLKKGFEQVAGITNISVIRKKSPMFSIYSPDVYKNAGSDTWIVFGEARVENLGRMLNPGAQRAARAAAAASSSSGGVDLAAEAEAAAAAGAPAAGADAAGEEDVDETGIDSNDIELIVAQANCSRARAVKALRNNSMDVVNAIMEITS
ncbi:hypothetical protein H4R18_003749 [Coemansia javaensis]|uniref:Nascent polypeptide-associated complex subunit alpha n=1 Tax=Coemansia javaensis TaxID=2761396 RepID=A0A9W8H858_9FUNG|nr:hypothetical protein H4R18_003749 [Coemansia javaensis]